jgi:hypothetical protein
MKLGRRPLQDPNRLVELEQQLEAHMSDVIAEAADAGFSSAEVLMALRVVCERQHVALSADPDQSDDPL